MFHLKHLDLAYPGKKVLTDFSLSLPAQGLVGISGPSGCGKTTLLRVLAGLQQPQAGRLEGFAAVKVSMVFQEDRLLPWLTARENLQLVFNDYAQAVLWLERMQMTDKADVYPEQLSGGMQRRVALARGLGYPGQLLLLDEPFKGLDKTLKQTLYPLVQACAADRLVLLVSHDHQEIQELSDQILLAAGPPLRLTKAAERGKDPA